jgi:type VI secretion system protein ImpI
MYLTLEVVSPHGASLGASRRQVVGPKGLTIGRAPDNDWVIPDPYVSKQHARIVCNDGRFFLEGLGRNPIAVGSAGNSIAPSERRELDSGDRIFIDQYEILVTAVAEEPASPTPLIVDPDAQTAELDPLHALGGEPPVEGMVGLQQAAPLAEHYRPPAPVKAIPENWSRSVVVPRPQAPRREPIPADLTALLRAAGVPEGELSAEVVQELGKVLRVVIQGVMEVLQGRAEIKSQFRLPLTRIQARENNPLKLSPNVESALHTLLVQRNPGYLPTVQAFEDAFADIRNHQLAMLEGVRMAFESMLSAFEPRQMEQDFERVVKRAGLLGGLGGKSRYWELYAEHFERLGRDADDTFRRLFGDVFAEAYEGQLERLKKEGP